MRTASRREQLARLLEHTGSLATILKLRARYPTPWLTVLTYHRFPSRGGVDPFDDGVVDVTAERFEQQVAYLKRNFTVVGVPELCAFAEGRPLPPNPVAISFDDGYLGCYETALPILKRLDCKAIFFVVTARLEEPRIHWWDRIAYVLKASPRASLHLEYPERVSFDLTGARHPAIRAVLKLVKSYPSLDLPRFLDDLSRNAGVPWSAAVDRRFASELLMTWDHVRALHRAGMDVHSHTRTHRVLQTLSPADLRDELEGSRDELRRELGVAPRALAYPVGNPLASTSPLRAAIRAAGYEIGFTNGTGPTPLHAAVDPFHICRQTVGQEMSDALLRAILAVPALAPRHPWGEVEAGDA